MRTISVKRSEYKNVLFFVTMEKADLAGRLAVAGYCSAYPELDKGKSLQNIILKAKVNDNVLLYQIKGVSNIVIKVDFSKKQNVEVTARDFLMDVVFKN